MLGRLASSYNDVLNFSHLIIGILSLDVSKCVAIVYDYFFFLFLNLFFLFLSSSHRRVLDEAYSTVIDIIALLKCTR